MGPLVFLPNCNIDSDEWCKYFYLFLDSGPGPASSNVSLLGKYMHTKYWSYVEIHLAIYLHVIKG